MAIAPPATLYSLGGIVQWIDQALTTAFVIGVAGNIERLTHTIWLPLEVGVTIYLLFYGYLIATQQIPTPFGAALWRILKIILVVGIIEAGGFYQTHIAEAMLALPDEVVKSITGETTSAKDMLADFHNSGLETATKLEERMPDAFFDMFMSVLFAGVALLITIIYTIVTILGLVLMVIAKFGMAIVIMIGPIFISALLFDSTKELFQGWLRQAVYFSLYGLLFTLTFSLVMGMLGYVQTIILGMADADAINIFQILAVILIVSAMAMFLLKLPSMILRTITGGASIDLPFIGQI